MVIYPSIYYDFYQLLQAYDSEVLSFRSYTPYYLDWEPHDLMLYSYSVCLCLHFTQIANYLSKSPDLQYNSMFEELSLLG